MGRGQLLRYCNQNFSGQLCSKMLTCMCNIVTTTKGQEPSQEDMRSPRGTFKKLKCLTAGVLIS